MSSDETQTIAQLKSWDVLWPKDSTIYPENWKMWVCVSAEKLWFVRVNTREITPPTILLTKDLHPFLVYDSWLGCGGDLISVQEVELEEALRAQCHPKRKGKVGEIHPSVRSGALEAISQSNRLSPAQIRTIIKSCS